MGRYFLGPQIGKNWENNFRNIPEKQLDELFEEAGFDQVDYIIASDVIFSSKTLKDFEKIIEKIVAIFTKREIKVPIIYLSHKARHEAVDDQLVEMIENLGFYGEQVEEEDMDPNYIDRRVDIFKLEYEMK